MLFSFQCVNTESYIENCIMINKRYRIKTNRKISYYSVTRKMITNVKRVSRGSQAICEEQSAGAVRLRRRIIELLSDCDSKSENKRDTLRSKRGSRLQN